MEKHFKTKPIQIITFVILFSFLFPAIYVDASESLEHIDGTLYYGGRVTGGSGGGVTGTVQNYAGPDIYASDILPYSPPGISLGPVLPGSMFRTNNQITSPGEYIVTGFFASFTHSQIAKGMAEFWVKTPVYLEPGTFEKSVLEIYPLWGTNYTICISELSNNDSYDPTNELWEDYIYQGTVFDHDINFTGHSSGIVGEANNWNYMVNLGAPATIPYIVMHRCNVVLKPSWHYFFKITTYYKYTGTPIRPILALSNEDICSDGVMYGYFNNSVSGIPQPIPMDYDVTYIFTASCNSEKALIPITLEPGDLLTFYNFQEFTGLWQCWILPLYPENNLPLNFTIYVHGLPSATLYVNLMDFYVSNDAIIISSSEPVMDQELLFELYYHGAYGDPNASVTIYLPVIGHETYSDYRVTHLDVIWHNRATAPTQYRQYWYRYGILNMSSTTPFNLNYSATYGFATYTEPWYYTNSFQGFASIGGSANSQEYAWWQTASTWVSQTGDQITDSTSAIIGALQNEFSEFANSLSIPDIFNTIYSKFQSMYDYMYNYLGGVSQDLMANITKGISVITDTADFIFGEIVMQGEKYWNKFTTWTGNVLSDLLDPIFEVVYEIRATIEKVIEIIISILEYILGIIMAVTGLMIIIPTLCMIGSTFLYIGCLNRIGGRKDPSSPHYQKSLFDWRN